MAIRHHLLLLAILCALLGQAIFARAQSAGSAEAVDSDDDDSQEPVTELPPRPACYKWERLNSTAQAGETPRHSHFSWAGHGGSTVFVAGGCYRKDEDIGRAAVKASGFCSLLAKDAIMLDVASQRWSNVTVFSPLGKPVNVEVAEAASAYDAASDSVFFYGGVNALGVVGGLHVLTPRVRHERSAGKNRTVVTGLEMHTPVTFGDVPPALRGAAMVVYKKQLILHGGVTAAGAYSSDMYVLELEAGLVWRKLVFAMTPSGRHGHSLSVLPPNEGTDELAMVLLGGADDASLSDVWLFSGSSPTWSWVRVTPRPHPGAAEPLPRFAHAAAVHESDVIVIGGCDKARGTCYDHVQALDTKTWEWLPVPPSLVGSRLPAHSVRSSAPEEASGKLALTYRSHPARGGATAVVLPANPADPTASTGRVVVAFGCADLACTSRDNVRQVSVLDVSAVCPNSCAASVGRGQYVEENGSGVDSPLEDLAYTPSRCACKPSFFGRFCENEHQCPGGCSGRGDCAIERRDKQTVRYCKCLPGFWGADCSQDNCPAQCSGRGVCQPGPDPVFIKGALDPHSPAAALVTKPRELLRLPAKMSKDIKIPQWLSLGPNVVRASRNVIQNERNVGPDGQPASPVSSFLASTALAQGVRQSDASQTHCACRLGFTGPDCSLVPSGAPKIRCANDCSGHGLCDPHGQCACAQGFAGSDCSVQCPSLCSGNGVCSARGKCTCAKGFRGRDCAQPYCADHCSNHGSCGPDGNCACKPGWTGRFCDVATHCSGNGAIVDGACKCKPGWGNAQCSQRIYCPNACSANGECVVLPALGPISSLLGRPVSSTAFPGEPDTPPSVALGLLEIGAEATYSEIEGVCKCAPGWRGADCSRRVCPVECKHGFCNDGGQCTCYPGYKGEDCRVLVACPGNCTSSTHGTCANGACACNPGWAGDNCAQPTCPKGCSGNGDCNKGVCKCKPGFGGIDCSGECAGRCSGQGDCIDGKCRCQPGFQGKDCSTVARCPRNQFIHPHLDCSGHGFCFRPGRKCVCEPGYTGKDCSQDDGSCGVGSCGNHGTCRHGKCYCDLGWSGSHCEYQNQCPANCNRRGFCLHGQCHCYTGFEGVACEKLVEDASCPKDCNGQGLCQKGKCHCAEGFSGEDCSTVTGFCKDNTCSGRGVCKFGKCFCEPGSYGKKCERSGCKKCADGKGVCVQGRCHCLPGFSGKSCEQELTCPQGCHGRGICTLGTCACLPGFYGADCSQLADDNKMCPGSCSGRGVCHLGKCFCIDGYAGSDCSRLTPGSCPDNCGGKAPTFDQRGTCLFGRCFCKLGFAGEGCETELRCPTKCKENGICLGGACFCSPGYSGHDCQTYLNNTVRDALFAADISPFGAVSFIEHVNNGESATITTRFPAPAAKPTRKAAFSAVTYADETASAFLQMDAEVAATDADAPSVVAEAAPAAEADSDLSADELKFLSAQAAPLPPVEPLAQADASAAAAAAPAAFAVADSATDAAAGADPAAESAAGSTAVSSDLAACGAVTQGCSHGMCVNSQCLCLPGYAGQDCNTTLVAKEWKRCPNGCSSHGTCIFGRCVCDLGFASVDCSRREALPCPRDCSGHGICHHGKCFCEPGFAGVACAVVQRCEAGCGVNGVCFRAQCVCAKGFYGARCEFALSDEDKPGSIVATDSDFSLLRYLNPEIENPAEITDILGPVRNAAAPLPTAQVAPRSTQPASSASTTDFPAPRMTTPAPVAAGVAAPAVAASSGLTRVETDSAAAAPATSEANKPKAAALARQPKSAKPVFIDQTELAAMPAAERAALEAALQVSADEHAFACAEGCGMNGRCLSGKCYCAPGFGGAACEHMLPVSLAEIDATAVEIDVASPAAPSAQADALVNSLAAKLSPASAATFAAVASGHKTSAGTQGVVQVEAVSGGWSVPPLVLVVIGFCAGVVFQALSKLFLGGGSSSSSGSRGSKYL